ncbi:TetR/AcrR family transcriptional regulator [Myxococcota bacterium]|nr:TetR/AcrR family transcriptional regulator [Myxococcota bacterium]
MTRHLPEQARRDQILAAARSCFIDRGYHPTRMEDIASTAGLSKGGVYFHFQSKQEVFDALVHEEYERSMAVLRSVSDMQAPVAEKMQILGKHYLEYFSSAPDAPRFFVVMGEMGLRDQNLAKRLLEMQTAYIDQIAKLIDQGVEEGVLRPVDSRAIAAMLKALLDGIEGLQALHFQFDLTQYLQVGLDLLLNGLVKR